VTRPEILSALDALDTITRQLRRECPWDREQDERSIVPHTVEEAYELADAAERGDDAKLLDELGDVLFQVHFLSLLMEERGTGDLAAVAEHCRQKLIRRHPHVFGDVEVENASDVLANWDEIKRGEAGREPGVFGDVPPNLPGPLYARKLQRRAASAGRYEAAEDPREALARLDAADSEARTEALGDALFALVDRARRERIDPELALRAAADRFRAGIEAHTETTRSP
jgi:MazG family protein